MRRGVVWTFAPPLSAVRRVSGHTTSGAARAALLAVLGAVLAVSLAACGSGESAAPTTTEQTQPAPAATPSPPPPPIEPPPPSALPPPPPEPEVKTVVITVREGRPVGGIARPEVKKGETVTVVVKSDVADEVHLHGYDISRRVAVGGTARLQFVADIPGRFELELEDSGVSLAELTVR